MIYEIQIIVEYVPQQIGLRHKQDSKQVSTTIIIKNNNNKNMLANKNTT